ncbi:phage tail sheath family protein [Mycolicibacterium celeriflavum]|uniref:phage tail sheath family protein n=1 Tax=Mycolicibacterium celeriflavum TaxID=1249101 RepID=UPI003CEAAC97
MPVQVTYPGVYVQEIPSGSRAITGVATSICAFVGRALRGPVEEPISISSYGDFERIFGGLWMESGLGYAVRAFYLNGGRDAVIVRLAGANAAAAKFAGNFLPIEASGPGVWGNGLTATVAHPDDKEADVVAAAQGVPKNQLFHLTLAAGEDREQYLNVTVVDGPRRVDRVLRSSTLAAVSGASLPNSRPAEAAKTATGGADGDGLTDEAYVDDGFEDSKRGIYALEKADYFTLLCLPPPSPAADLPVALWADALTYCKKRRAFLLVDPPAAEVVSSIKAWPGANGLLADGRNGALYFPRLRCPDPLRDGTVADFAPCGAVAGTIARVDGERGVWKAPAGIDAGLAGVNGLTVTLTDSDSGALNPIGINCLRTFRNTGTVVWGARTLRGADGIADEYKYIPVRRLALYLEESLFRGTQWVVFEPNDEPLWAQIRMSVGAFMQDLFRQGAFTGVTPRHAYFVRCDGETTSQFDRDRGIVNITVGFAPLKPAEFVVITIQQKTADAEA